MSPNINTPDYFAIVCEHSDRHHGEVSLHPLEGGGWCVRVLANGKMHSGEAKGRSPKEAAEKLVKLLKLKANA